MLVRVLLLVLVGTNCQVMRRQRRSPRSSPAALAVGVQAATHPGQSRQTRWTRRLARSDEVSRNLGGIAATDPTPSYTGSGGKAVSRAQHLQANAAHLLSGRWQGLCRQWHGRRCRRGRLGLVET